MNSLFFEEDVALDIEAAKHWYDLQLPGLGRHFVSDLEAALQRIQSNPRSYQESFPPVRCALLKRFPYKVCFVIEDGAVYVVAIFHQARSDVWIESRMK